MPQDVLIVGTGEYTTGYVATAEGGASDKKMGIVGLCMFDLRRRGVVGRIVFAGTDGTKFPFIRTHFAETIAQNYKGMDTAFESFPADTEKNPLAYAMAINSMRPGDFVFIYTPDDTHYSIALCALEHGLNVLLTKPGTKTLEQHQHLVRVAKEKNVMLCLDMHKRHDPIYADAVLRSRALGPFSFFTSYMSQPKKQLQTFGKWAGSGSDISYYLNTHHVDLVAWILQGRSIPVSVVANSSRGFADQAGLSTEDVITLMVQWQNLEAGTTGTSIHTASWIAPKSDVHSQQRFHYVGHRGEVTVDQAHRGYSTATDQDGYSSVNPLYMKYSPDAHGYFNGQRGYGYTILEAFLMKDTAASVLMSDTAALWTSAIMEAGRRSLDAGGAVVDLIPSAEDPSFPGRLELRGK